MSSSSTNSEAYSAQRSSTMTAQVFAIDSDLTISHAAVLGPLLLHAAAAGEGPLVLDLAAVAEIDTAGLQLLLLARREAMARGRCLTLRQARPAVRDLLDLCNMGVQLPGAALGEGA